MPLQLPYLRRRFVTSIWLIPTALCVLSLILGWVMLWTDRHQPGLLGNLQMFAMPVDSARQVLSVIAGSVISVGGVSFSVTMVALTLTSGQYGPKVIRHFLEDNDSKISLGLFLGTYVYALIVLTGYIESDRPHASVLVALLLALAAIIGFVRFIHRVAIDLQADEIVENIGRRLRSTLHSLASDEAGPTRVHDTLAWRRQARGQRVHIIGGSQQGYVQTVDYRGVSDWCATHDCCVSIQVRAGDFVIPGMCIMKVFGGNSRAIDHQLTQLDNLIVTGPVRTAAQDPEYPITQLNQLAARALSPGINDPGTAISCIDSFCLALAGILDRDLPGSVVLDEAGTARCLARRSDFAGLMKAVFTPLRQFARTEVSVTVALLEALSRLAALTTRRDRLDCLRRHGQLIVDGIDSDAISPYDLRDIRQRAKRLEILVTRFDQPA